MTDLEVSCLYGSIMFYVGKKTIVLNKFTYTLGELTADILNISPENYRGMKEILLRAEEICPDATFTFELMKDEPSMAWLKENGLI